MRKILITGALRQIGSELVVELRRLKGAGNVVASDIRLPPGDMGLDGPFEVLDATNARQAHDLVRRHDIESPGPARSPIRLSRRSRFR